MDISYGITTLDSNDPYISIAEEVSGGIAEAGVPGAFLVDLIPILKYVPSWFPGAGFKKKAKRWRACFANIIEKPYQRVMDDLARTTSLLQIVDLLMLEFRKKEQLGPLYFNH